jgi:hypothetical protein
MRNQPTSGDVLPVEDHATASEGEHKVNVISTALGIVALLALAACNQAKSPDTVQKDVNKAEDSGAEKIVRAEDKEAKVDARQDSKVESAIDSANSKTGAASVDTIVAQAEADTRVALARCEALAGAQQKACRDEANAQLDLVKARAKEVKSAQGN